MKILLSAPFTSECLPYGRGFLPSSAVRYTSRTQGGARAVPVGLTSAFGCGHGAHGITTTTEVPSLLIWVEVVI